MPTKRGRLVKTLRKMVEVFPPENVAPWKKPNNALQKVIDKQCKQQLEEQLEELQESMLRRFFAKVERGTERLPRYP